MAVFTLGVTFAMVLLAATGLLDMLRAALLAALTRVVGKALTPAEARRSVDLDVIVLIASSFGLGSAIEASGLADRVAGLVVAASGALGPVGILAGVALVTMLLTELITNTAAAVLVFPVAVSTAMAAGLDPRPFAMVVAFAASGSFLTPIGYQTNTMVYGPGGYRFTDYLRLGLPLSVIELAILAALVPLIWPL
jgi:di/tricarboxylate transporter